MVTLERTPPVEQVHCGRVVRTKQSVLTCLREQVARTVAQLSQRLIDWTELGPIPVGLLEVVADDLLVGGFVEPVGEAFVQLSTDFLRDPAVGGVADEDVAEAEGILIRQARALRLDEPSAHKSLKKDAHLRPGCGEMESAAQNSLPTTAAASSNARSPEASRSRRAESSAWIVSGTAASWPSSSAKASNCSRKSGFQPRSRAGSPGRPRQQAWRRASLPPRSKAARAR